MNTFALQMIAGLTAQYRYALLTLYSSIGSLLVIIILTTLAYVSFSASSNALFILLGLVIVAQTVGALVSGLILFGYYHIYTVSGFDPVGSIFARIEAEEKELEKRATEALTRFQ